MQTFPYEVSIDFSDIRWRGPELQIDGYLTQRGDFPISLDSRTDEHPLRLGFRVFDPAWQHILFEGRAVSIASSLEPGRAVAFTAGIATKDLPIDGDIAIYFGLLYEHEFWFRDRSEDVGLRVHLQVNASGPKDTLPLRPSPGSISQALTTHSKPARTASAVGLESTVARLARSTQELEERVGKIEQSLNKLAQQFEEDVTVWANYFPQLLNAIATSNAAAKESLLLKREVERALVRIPT